MHPTSIRSTQNGREPDLYADRQHIVPLHPSAPLAPADLLGRDCVDRFGNESQPLALNIPDSAGIQTITLQNLPRIPENCMLIISDATGQEVLRTAHSTREMLQRLGNGLFRFSIQTPDGQTRLVGMGALNQPLVE